ncbi:kelch-like protein 30 [Amphiura filiformis]|uniref:kelch-like protein 30 n=1 Tax=Amphiura filiformis TaxID=82378 RepID=UPI003B21C055
MAFSFPIIPHAFEPMARPMVVDDDDGVGYGYRHYDDDDDSESNESDSEESDMSRTHVTDYACGLLKDVKRLQSQFCDVTIKVDGSVFRGHRHVLAAASRYFEDMFSSSAFQESQMNEVELKDMNRAIFELIFNFMYSGQMDLSKKTAITACHSAAYLGVRNVEGVFIDYFDRAIRKEKITPAELLSLWPGVDENGMKRVSSAARCDLLKNFKQVVESDQFVEKAPSELIHDYLIRGTKHFGSEEQLLRHVINWLKHDWEKRKHHTLKFLKLFRLALLERGKVQELLDAQILEIAECKKMMDDLIATWTEFEGVDDPLKLPESLLPKGMMRTIIGFGGRREIVDECFRHELRAQEMRLFAHYYNKKTRLWTLLNYPESPGGEWNLDWPSMVVVNRDIYLAGGLHCASEYSDKLCGSNQLFRLDGNSYKWTNLPPMKQARFLFSMVHHDGFLYAIGGRTQSRKSSKESGYSDSAERFNLSQQKWDCIYKLPAEMAYTSTAMLDGKLLVYGLSNYLEKEKASQFKLLGFDPVTQEWTELLQETYTADDDMDGIIVVHNGACYRVRYEKLSSPIRLPIDSYEDNPWMQQSTMEFIPHVNRIEMKPVEAGEEGSVRACIGHELEGQDTIPANLAGAFHIDGHIYINVCRVVHNTGVVQGDPKSDVTWLNRWHRCYSMGTKCVVEYAFDTKKMR